MWTTVVDGVTVGVFLGFCLTPFVVWAWLRIRLTEWWVFLGLAGALVSGGMESVEVWGLWSLPVFGVSALTVLATIRGMVIRLREPGYRPTGFFPFGKAPASVRNWMSN